jgi:hypothetical protein
LVKLGGKRSVEEAAMQREREPVVWPPRPSWTVTVRRQLLHVPAGTEEGTKEAALEVAFVQLPGQEESHRKERASPSASEARAEREVDCPASRRLREAETLETVGQRLKETLREALPVAVPETTLTVRETEMAAP